MVSSTVSSRRLGDGDTVAVRSFVRAVKNHGLATDLVEKVFEQVRAFFALPLEEKMKIPQDANDRGYVPPFAEKLDLATKNDSKERINFGLEVLSHHRHHHHSND